MNEMKVGKRTKKFNDFFTPYSVSERLFNMYYPALQEQYSKCKRRLSILEPAVGTGNLLWPLLASEIPVIITCIDIQDEYLEHLATEAEAQGYQVGMRKGLLTISNHPEID